MRTTSSPRAQESSSQKSPPPPARSGWRERIEPGLYRAHRLACPASGDRQPGQRCRCSFQALVPGPQPGRTRTLTIAGSLSEARAAKRRLMGARRPAVPPPAPAADQTLDAFTAHYLRARSAVLSPHTIAGTDTEYRLRISPALGHLHLTQITRERVELWLADLAARATSRRMIVQTAGALRVILAAAVEWGRIATNPAARLRLPAPDTHERQAIERVLDEAQLARLFTQGAGSLRAETILRAAAEAGLRRGEIIGLKWPDVHLAERRLEVRRSVWQVGGERGEKTAKGRRSRKVAITGAFAARLAAWYEESVIQGGADATGYVWPGQRGAPMNAHSPTQTTARALARAGLVDAEGRPLVTLHGLRHSCGSILLAHGVPLIVVSRHLGHADPNITARVYAHLLNDTQLDQAAAVFTAIADADTMTDRMHTHTDPPETRLHTAITPPRMEP